MLILELIGTVAFSISGAVTASKKQMDLLGIIILGACAALGGGVLRDIMLGITPPTMFKNPIYAAVAAVSSLIVFVPHVQRLLAGNRVYDIIMLIMDSLGLGVFTVVGIQTALANSESYNSFLLVVVGVLTGVGGGVIRDVLAGERPYIFVKHFYACASIIGAVACVALKSVVGINTASFIGAVLVISLRIMAATFRWKLPKPARYDEDGAEK